MFVLYVQSLVDYKEKIGIPTEGMEYQNWCRTYYAMLFFYIMILKFCQGLAPKQTEVPAMTIPYLFVCSASRVKLSIF